MMTNIIVSHNWKLTSSYSRVSSFQLILFIMSRLNFRCDLGPPSTTTIEQSRFKIVAPVMYSCFEFISILNFFFASFNDLLSGWEMHHSEWSIWRKIIEIIETVPNSINCDFHTYWSVLLKLLYLLLALLLVCQFSGEIVLLVLPLAFSHLLSNMLLNFCRISNGCRIEHAHHVRQFDLKCCLKFIHFRQNFYLRLRRG